MQRRRFLTASLAVLAGCSGLTGPDSEPTQSDTVNTETERTASETETVIPKMADGLPDLQIDNERAEDVEVQLTWTPEDADEPALDRTYSVDALSRIRREQIDVFNQEGTISAKLVRRSGEDLTASKFWGGDNSGDNNGLIVTVRENDLTISRIVA